MCIRDSFLLGNVIVKGKGLFKELLAVGAQLLAVFIVGGEHLPVSYTHLDVYKRQGLHAR